MATECCSAAHSRTVSNVVLRVSCYLTRNSLMRSETNLGTTNRGDLLENDVPNKRELTNRAKYTTNRNAVREYFVP